MGKPIAGRNKSPFGINGVIVDAAVLKDGTKLTNLRISKQRSVNVFDLISADGKTLYPFMHIAGTDKSDKALDFSASADALGELLKPGHFCVKCSDSDAEGFAFRLHLNKVLLHDGRGVYSGYSQSEVVIPADVSVTGIALSAESLELKVGELAQLIASVLPANATNKSVLWSSSASHLVSVDQNGNCKGIDNGFSTVTATTADGNFVASAFVVVQTPVTGVSVDPHEAELAIGSTVQLTATVTPANASVKNIIWSTVNPDVALVDADGLVTAVAKGTVIVNAQTADGNFVDSVQITVTE